MRLTAPIVAASAAAALIAGCSPGDEPADRAAAAAPTTRAATPTTATAPTGTAESTTGTAGTTTEPAAAAGATTSGSSHMISITVAAGQITPAPAPVDVRVDTPMVIDVTTDVDDELYVQGYEQRLPLKAGQPARLGFTADEPGQFEVRLAASGRLLCLLRVS